MLSLSDSDPIQDTWGLSRYLLVQLSTPQAHLLSEPFELFPVPLDRDPFGVDAPGPLPQGLARGRELARA